MPTRKSLGSGGRISIEIRHMSGRSTGRNMSLNAAEQSQNWPDWNCTSTADQLRATIASGLKTQQLDRRRRAASKSADSPAPHGGKAPSNREKRFGKQTKS